jgi:hypothetical protein
MMRKLRIDEVVSMGHANIFEEPSMQEGIMNINMMDGPA